MRPVIVRRALTAALAITMLTIPSVSAESVGADGDVVTAGLQDTIDLGTAEPGQAISFNVYFSVACSGTNHVNSGQSVRLVSTPPVIPAGVGYSVPTLTFRLPAGWPADGVACPEGLAPAVGGPLQIVFTAPPTPGVDYAYRFSWNRIATPSSGADADVFSGPNPTINFILDVGTPPPPPNTAPGLVLPADLVVEGDTTGGALAAYAVSATDAEDAVAPTPTCTPAVGALLPLGTTAVDCSATDSSGLSTSGSFAITVVDTTAPSLVGVPGDVDLMTDGSDATLTYSAPTATDVVDPSPSVGCMPASGSSIPVGDTTVTCTAGDASGNSASATFAAHVTYVAPPPPEPPAPEPPAPEPPAPEPPAPAPVAGRAVWGWPIRHGRVVVNDHRNFPVTVKLLVDGKRLRAGSPVLSVVSCSGGPVLRTANLHRVWKSRWMAKLWTGGIGTGCFNVTASLNGQDLGSFTMKVREHGWACRGYRGHFKH